MLGKVAVGLLALTPLLAEAFVGPAVGSLPVLRSNGNGITAKVSTVRAAPLSLSMQESRGICPVCGTDVMNNQPREVGKDGLYYHFECLEQKYAAEGNARVSQAELDELRQIVATGKRPAKKAPAQPAGNPFGFLGGLFGGGGDGGANKEAGGFELPDLPGAPPASSPAPSMGAPAAPAPPPPPPAAVPQATVPAMPQPASNRPKLGNIPAGFQDAGPQIVSPPAGAGAGAPGPAAGIQQGGVRALPKAGMDVPFDWIEGQDYFLDRRNRFEMGEIIALIRSDGSKKFAYVLKINEKRDLLGNEVGPPSYDVQVDNKGSYYQGRMADSLFKFNFDVKTVGIPLPGSQVERGWF